MIVLIICSCTDENDAGTVKEPVDQDYLKSESYQSFTKRSRLERKRSIKQEANLAKFVQQQLTNFEGEELTLSAVINEEMMKSSYRNDPADRSSLIRLFGFQQIYHPLAKIEADDLDYYFFMTCKVTSYKDCLIWFASVKRGALIQIEMLTTYKKTLTYSEIPRLRITNSSIAIDVDGSVEYPLSSINKYTLRYNITNDGKIFRVQNK